MILKSSVSFKYEYWSEEEIKKEKEYYLDYEFDLK